MTAGQFGKKLSNFWKEFSADYRAAKGGDLLKGTGIVVAVVAIVSILASLHPAQSAPLDLGSDHQDRETCVFFATTPRPVGVNTTINGTFFKGVPSDALAKKFCKTNNNSVDWVM
jgi:hypothetical protein